MKDNRNTAFGWILFSGVIALGASSISSMYFHADDNELPEGAEPGFFIQADEEEGAADAGPPFANLLAAGSASAGEAVFAKCTACHTIAQGGADGIGPNLWGVLGKPIGKHAAGFAYSSALSGHGGDWTYENMDAWLTSPKAFANGTKMSFAGLSKPEDRANVMEYLAANGGAPAKPAPVAPEADEADDAVDLGGETPTDAEAAGAMAADEPVAADNAATEAGGVKPGA